MTEFSATPKELMAIFPRAVPGMSAVSLKNTLDELWIVYALRGVKDPDLDWEKYQAWKADYERQSAEQKDEDGFFCMKRPQDVMPVIYWQNTSALDTGILTPNDTMLGSFEIELRFSSEKTAFITRIDRRKPLTSPDEFKGEGSAFYTNLAGYLKSRGFRFVRLMPEHENLEVYWRKQGFLPLDDVKPGKMVEIDRGNGGLVHFIYEEDRAEFLK